MYIDSQGGNVHLMNHILQLLRSRDLDSNPPCRVITVLIGRAWSAAATFLASGDYAYANRDSSIFFHGVRQELTEHITVEHGSKITEILKERNEVSAMQVARRTENRFMFRYTSLYPQFPEYRARQKEPRLSNLDCFIGLISTHLSPPALQLLDRAKERNSKYNELLQGPMLNAFKRKKNAVLSPLASTEGQILKKIIDFEISKHKSEPNWAFSSGGLACVQDDFLLLVEYLTSVDGTHFERLCKRWGKFAIKPSEADRISKLSDEKTRENESLKVAQDQFRPLFAYLVALCHALQEGEENWLTPVDALWLGIIDEVIGYTELPTIRTIVESKPATEPAADTLES